MVDLGSRGYYDVKNYVEVLPLGDQEKMVDRLRAGSLDYGITSEMAEKMEVRVHGRMHSLKWVADNNPERLEYMMDTMNPGSVLFEAVTLVYNKNLDKIVPAVEKENARIRDAGIKGLHDWAERKRGDKPRVRLRLFLKPGVLDEKPRVYLMTGYSREKPRIYLN